MYINYLEVLVKMSKIPVIIYGRRVGEIDRDGDGIWTYFTIRESGTLFVKYNKGLAISIKIKKDYFDRLEREHNIKVRRIRCTISDLPYDYVIELSKFYQHCFKKFYENQINSDPQLVCPGNFITKVTREQVKLTNN